MLTQTSCNLIGTVVFMVVAIIGMSNGIVLPTTVLGPGSHLDDLIRDIFAVHDANGTMANSTGSGTTPANGAGSANVCWGRCVPVHLRCVDNDITDDHETEIPAYDDEDTDDGFLDIRIANYAETATAAAAATHPKRVFCAAGAEKCCTAAVEQMEIASLAIKPAVVVDMMDGSEVAHRTSNVCGQSLAETADTIDRVISDGASEIDEFPWMAAILWTNAAGRVAYKCGSSLIHPSVVLTVAHCVHRTDAARLLVRIGQRDIIVAGRRSPQWRSTGVHHQDRRIRQVIVHEHFNASRRSLHNDIALLFLDMPVQLSAAGLRTVCLPTVRSSFDRRRCVVSGWGAPVRGPHQEAATAGAASMRVRRVLKKIQVPVVPRTLCERSLRTTRLGRRFRLHRSFLCAGGEPGRDACTGDGGSPLVCPEMSGEGEGDSGRVRYVQAGIVALGIGCGNQVPSVYVNVAEFRPWIDDQMLVNGYARSFYRL